MLCSRKNRKPLISHHWEGELCWSVVAKKGEGNWQRLHFTFSFSSSFWFPLPTHRFSTQLRSCAESKKMLSVAGVAPLSSSYQYSLNTGLFLSDFLWGLNLPAKLQGKCNPIALGKQLQYKWCCSSLATKWSNCFHTEQPGSRTQLGEAPF